MPLPDYPRLLTARSCHATPLGPLHLACTANALAGAWFEPQRHFDTASLSGVPLQPAHPVLQAAATALDAYFQGQLTGYAGGLERKTALLHLEQSQTELL